MRTVKVEQVTKVAVAAVEGSCPENIVFPDRTSNPVVTEAGVRLGSCSGGPGGWRMRAFGTIAAPSSGSSTTASSGHGGHFFIRTSALRGLKQTTGSGDPTTVAAKLSPNITPKSDGGSSPGSRTSASLEIKSGRALP